jgi:ribonuclease Y
VSLLASILVVTIGFLVGLLVLGYLFHKRKFAQAFEVAQAESKRILNEARKAADQVVQEALVEAKNDARKRRRIFEEESKNKQAELKKLERKVQERESLLSKKGEQLQNRESDLETKEIALEAREKKLLRRTADVEVLLEKYEALLANVAQLSIEEAKQELMKLLEKDAREKFGARLQEIEAQARKEASNKATEIVSLAVQRLASEFVNDAAVTVLSLPSEEMKGRIIGREGRNIRALEQATGVDLIIDDTPEAVILSCFNPIRREIAKLTLERLIADGRIHPARIEETAHKITREFDLTLREYGEQAVFDVGITDIHPDLMYLLGKLRFRSVGVQSVLEHSIETARICSLMAAELGIDARLAKRAGLLHDIGKAVDQDTEGHHAEIAADLLKKYGEAKEIIDAVRLHHAEDLQHATALAVILHAANTLSGRRPGSRKETLASYIKRLDTMEKLVVDFHGVEKAFVLQAGREVRVFVVPDKNSDEQVKTLSGDIASALRKEITFPGQVQVTVIKETTHVVFAS